MEGTASLGSYKAHCLFFLFFFYSRCLANEREKNQDLIQKIERLKKRDPQHSEHFSGDKSNKREVIEKETWREHHSQDTTLVRKVQDM